MASTRPTLLSLFTAAVLFLHFYQTSAVVTWGASCPSNIRAPLLQDTIAMARAGYEALNNPESLDPWGRYNADAVYDVLFDAQHPKTITRRQGLIDDFHSILHVQHLPKEVLIKCDDADTLFEKAKILLKGLVPTITRTQDLFNFSSFDLNRHHQLIHFQQCNNQHETLGYYLPGSLFQTGKSDQDHKRIVLCYSTHQHIPWVSSDLPITHNSDRLSKRVTFSDVLGHEMLHALGTDIRRYKEAYGWEDAKSIRSIGGNKNPDSIMFFARAMFESEWCWGMDKALSKQSVYDRLKEEDPSVLIRYGLEKPT